MSRLVGRSGRLSISRAKTMLLSDVARTGEAFARRSKSFPRKQESSGVAESRWMPASAGMTEFSVHPLFQRHDPVLDRQLGAALQLREAADVGGEDPLGAARGERGKPVALQLRGELRLQDGVGTRRAAAQMCVRHRRELESGAGKQPLGHAFYALAMLQRARRMKRDPP